MSWRCTARPVLLAAALTVTSSCAPNGDEDLLSRLFVSLSHQNYDGAADLVRNRDGSPLAADVRARNIAGWRRSYDTYDVQFTRVVVTRALRLSDAELAALNATEGYVEAVRFEGKSNSPCVPVNSNVIPGTSQPVAVRSRTVGWFVTVDSMAGFISTCPGG